MNGFRGGFGGGFGGANLNQLMKQAQKMQADLQKAQEELKELEVTGSAASGMVEVTMTCDGKLSGIKIKPEAVDPDDVEMLEDLITADTASDLDVYSMMNDVLNSWCLIRVSSERFEHKYFKIFMEVLLLWHTQQQRRPH